MKKKLIHLLFLFILYILNEVILNFYKMYKYPKDDITLVSAYYQIKSKHSHSDYLKWMNNIVLLNKSFVFFTNKKFMPILKKLRPKELHYKTVFCELEMKDFYSYKTFYKEFNNSFYIDIENSYHTIPLYLVWAEKSMFVKRAILNNYFNSTCFYWIDAGYFRENIADMNKYINDWPTTKKCYEDERLLMGQVRNFSDIEKEKIINFDEEAHQRLQRNINVIGGLFGGKIENILKFIELYHNAIKLFYKKKLFIGKDQNIYTYLAFSHPEIIKLVLFPGYGYFKTYLA